MSPVSIFLPHIAQQTDSHCGPAVLQLLYSFLHRSFTQDEIAFAAGVSERILEDGTRPVQLAQAAADLTPDLQFWWKQESSAADLERIVEQYHWPVVINWQGLFYSSPEEEAENGASDTGHYSVVVGIDRQNDQITLVDPYPDFFSAPRVFALSWFEQRWWDSVRDINKLTGESVLTETKHLMFLITPQDVEFPLSLGMEKPLLLRL